MTMRSICPPVLLLLLPSVLLSVAVCSAVPTVPTLHQTVDRYLRHGGHAKLQSAFNLAPNVYYNPLQFFTRDDATFDDAPRHVPARMSDLELLRAMSLHVPGVDRLSSNASVAAVDTGCIQDPSPLHIVEANSRFVVSFSPNDVPIQVKTVVQDTTAIWARVFESTVPIRVCFMWKQLDMQTLGSTSTPVFVRGTPESRGMRDGVFYNPALASALEGEDVLGGAGNFDMHITLNSHMRWHFHRGSQANGERFDLATITLHELSHGLFFMGTVRVLGDTSAEFKGGHSRFDEFLGVHTGSDMIAVAQSCLQGPELNKAVRSSPLLRFVDKRRNTDFGLYAPPTFESGSSVYHFSNDTIEADCRAMGISRNQCSDLMTHELRKGYTRRLLGETTVRLYHALRGDSPGVVGDKPCDVPDVPQGPANPAAGGSGAEDEPFTLPVWGIAVVAGLAGVGILLVVGVVVSTIVARA